MLSNRRQISGFQHSPGLSPSILQKSNQLFVGLTKQGKEKAVYLMSS